MHGAALALAGLEHDAADLLVSICGVVQDVPPIAKKRAAEPGSGFELLYRSLNGAFVHTNSTSMLDQRSRCGGMRTRRCTVA